MVYEKLWSSLVTRLLQSKEYAIRQPFLPDDILKVMAELEKEFSEEIVRYQEDKKENIEDQIMKFKDLKWKYLDYEGKVMITVITNAPNKVLDEQLASLEEGWHRELFKARVQIAGFMI